MDFNEADPLLLVENVSQTVVAPRRRAWSERDRSAVVAVNRVCILAIDLCQRGRAKSWHCFFGKICHL